MADALKMSTADLVTRGDLKELELKLDARFADIRRDIEAMKADLPKWVNCSTASVGSNRSRHCTPCLVGFSRVSDFNAAAQWDYSAVMTGLNRGTA